MDLPHPDGPAIDTYSPRWISMDTSDRAWVSTSSVAKTFVTSSSLMTGGGIHRSAPPTARIRSKAIPGGHVRQDHLVADIQPDSTSTVFTELRPSLT